MIRKTRPIGFLLILIFILSLTGCGGYEFDETGTEIISADTALSMASNEGVVMVDTQKNSVYLDKGHVQGAVNIEREDIVVSDPVPNMLAPADQVGNTLGKAGISNDSMVLIYDDNNNMDAARLWWTMKVYGHENVKVVSGGLKALVEAGAQVSKDNTTVSEASYEIDSKNTEMIATLDEVKAQINEPKEGVKFLDTRTKEEFDSGTIPTSIHIDYINNNYPNGEYRSVQDVQIMYIENGVVPEDTSIMYCKTSIRAAQTYLVLYNAGYRNLKLYDGAWLEYTSDDSLPQQQSEDLPPVQPNQQDNS